MKAQIPWLRVFVEGVVIVGSILMAFGIEAWWDERQEAQVQADILFAARAEAIQNRSATLDEIDDASVRMAQIDQFLRLEAGAVPELPPRMLGGFLVLLMNPQTFDPALGASRLLLESPVATDHGVVARALMNEWLQVLANAQPRRDALWTQSEEVLRLMAPHAAPYASNGLEEGVPFMLARGGLEVVADLRADTDFVEAVSLKAHWQFVYTLQLEASIPLLDSLIVVLDGG